MRGSKRASLLGLLSLVLQICSCIIIPKVDSIIAYSAFSACGIVSSVIFIIPSIFLSYFEVRFPYLCQEELNRRTDIGIALSGASAGGFFSVGYGIFYLMFGLFMGPYMLYGAPLEGSQILGVVVVILFILTGILGIVATLVYRDDRLPNAYLKLKFLCKISGSHSYTGRGYCKKCGAHAFRKATKDDQLGIFKLTTRRRKFINKLKKGNSVI